MNATSRHAQRALAAASMQESVLDLIPCALAGRDMISVEFPGLESITFGELIADATEQAIALRAVFEVVTANDDEPENIAGFGNACMIVAGHLYSRLELLWEGVLALRLRDGMSAAKAQPLKFMNDLELSEFMAGAGMHGRDMELRYRIGSFSLRRDVTVDDASASALAIQAALVASLHALSGYQPGKTALDVVTFVRGCEMHLQQVQGLLALSAMGLGQSGKGGKAE